MKYDETWIQRIENSAEEQEAKVNVNGEKKIILNDIIWWQSLTSTLN